MFSLQFSHDSAYPKANPNPEEVQLISCDGDSYVLIWALRRFEDVTEATTSAGN